MPRWEWRVFLEVSVSQTGPGCKDGEVADIWDLLNCKLRSSSAEVRTDVYVACSPRSGVKFRSGETLEVKLRTEIHESGAERWDKVNWPVIYTVVPPIRVDIPCHSMQLRCVGIRREKKWCFMAHNSLTSPEVPVLGCSIVTAIGCMMIGLE